MSLPIPRKRFGQHFLCDQGVVQRIVSALAPQPTDHLIEIGPGQGALTLPVLKHTRQLEAIELDRDLIVSLQERCRQAGTLTLHEGDVLDVDFAALKQDARLLRVFGNLPYNISTPLIFHLLSYHHVIHDMLFMLQREVAHRLAAAPGTSDYSRLSVMVQYDCQVSLLFDVPPSAFFPPPQVHSSIVRLMPYASPPYHAKDKDVFAALVKQAFSMRRKTLRNSLKNLVSDAVWAQVSVASERRPDTVSVAEFVEIANQLT